MVDMYGIADYRVISEENLSTLEYTVKQKISEGWEPSGSVTGHNEQCNDGSGWTTVYTQAMVKRRQPGR